MCCDTAQALVFLLVSMCCGTAQALVFLLVSYVLPGISVLWHSPSLGVRAGVNNMLYHSPSLGIRAGVNVL